MSIFLTDSVTIEVVTLDVNVNDSAVVADAVVDINTLLGDINVNDSMIVSDVVSGITIIAPSAININVSDSLPISENLFVDNFIDINVNDALSIFDVVALEHFSNVFVFDSLGIADVVTPQKLGLEQEGFRFRNDDNNEALATWRQLQDVNDSIIKNTNFRLRFLINATGDPDSAQYQVEYKKTSDPDSSYRKVSIS